MGGRASVRADLPDDVAFDEAGKSFSQLLLFEGKGYLEVFDDGE